MTGDHSKTYGIRLNGFGWLEGFSGSGLPKWSRQADPTSARKFSLPADAELARLELSADDRIAARVELIPDWPAEDRPAVPRPFSEDVLCVPRHVAEMATDGLRDGLLVPRDNGWPEFFSRLFSAGATWADRKVADSDTSLVQVVPYAIGIRGQEVLWYRRKGTEDRLNGLLSVGFGGHVERKDAFYVDKHVPFMSPACGGDPGAYYASVAMACLAREWEEEVGNWHQDLPSFASPVGVIRCHDRPVDSLHLGILVTLRGTNFRTGALAASGLAWGWEKPIVLLHNDIAEVPGGRLESWSRIAIKHLLTRPDQGRENSNGKADPAPAERLE